MQLLTRLIAWVAAAMLAAACSSGGGSGSSAPPPPSQAAFVSGPDCPSVANMVSQSEDPPRDVTHMRVQHIGDPGTAELAGQIANAVTWSAGDFTGFHPADARASQRGFRDVGPPDPASVFQLACDGAGFLINTWQFGHRHALVGEGPSASIARVLSVHPVVLPNAAATLSIEARVDLRHVRYQGPHTAEGTAQLGFFYYMQDAASGTVIAHVIGIFDSRAPGVGGSAVEAILSDGQIAFASSPLAPAGANGAAVQFARPGAQSAWMRHVEAWREPVLFKAEVSYPAFAALLARLRAGPLPGISPRPEDYRLTLFGVLGEVFPGTGDDHNVALGASVFGLRLSGG